MNGLKIALAAGGLCFAGAAHAATDAITLDRLEPTGEKGRCLKLNELYGPIYVGASKFLFVSDGKFFLNEMQSRCEPPAGKPPGLMTKTSMVCRNDQLWYQNFPNDRPYLVCALGEFHEVRLKPAPLQSPPPDLAPAEAEPSGPPPGD